METILRKKSTEFLGKFPSHWEVRRIKNLFTEIDNRSVDGSEELLSVSQYTGITPKRDSLENEDDMVTNAETLEGYKKVSKGDLVINIMLAWNGSLGISTYDGISSPAYCVYRSLPGNNPEYFGHLFSTAFYKAEFKRNSTGIIDSRLRLYSEKFFGIFSVVPPLEEQNAIVNHINAQSEKINRFIETKLKFIQLLVEQRRGIVNNELNTSNSDFRIRKLKYCVSKVGSGVTPTGGASVYTKEGVTFLRSQNVHNDGLKLHDVAFITPQTHENMKSSKVCFNDVLVNITGGSIGRSYFIDDKLGEANVNQHVCILRPLIHVILPEFLMLQIQSDRIQNLISMIEGASREGLTNHDLKNYDLYVPPIENQRVIIEKIKTETSIIETTISKAEREIELIREYKEAMIAEAVMGVNINKTH